MSQNNQTKQFEKLKDDTLISNNIESIDAQVPLLTQNLEPQTLGTLLQDDGVSHSPLMKIKSNQ